MSTARTLPAAKTSRPILYLALTKPDVSFLVVMTTLAGFYSAPEERLTGS